MNVMYDNTKERFGLPTAGRATDPGTGRRADWRSNEEAADDREEAMREAGISGRNFQLMIQECFAKGDGFLLLYNGGRHYA